MQSAKQSIFAIGLKYIAYENLFFIVGCTFILSVISRFGLLVGLLLCIPVAVMEFSVGENGLNSLITLAVTGIVALLVEKKLHWLMIILPMRKDGIIPPSMLQAPQERTDSEGRGFSHVGFLYCSFIQYHTTLQFSLIYFLKYR